MPEGKREAQPPLTGHDAGHQAGPRIVLLIDRRGNRAQVAKQLQRHNELLIPDSDSLPRQGFDLVIADGAGLGRWRSELRRAREYEQPVFLPVMLILSRAEMRRQVIRYRDIIDEFIIAPIDAAEFRERVEMLLRARQLAVQQRQQLTYIANHDPGTGLPTRELFLNHVEIAIQHARQVDENVYVLAARVPMAQLVKSLGHSAIDDIATAIMGDLEDDFEEEFLVGRLGSDQGATLLPVGTSRTDASRFGHRQIRSMQRPKLIRGEWIRPVVHQGIACYPDDAGDATGLLEAAVNAASEANPGVPHFYSPDAQGHALQFLRIETGLHHALEHQEFELWFQPQFRISDQTLVGAEALIRWRRGSGELVLPGVFIPVAEHAGLIREIDRWVIEATCAALARWQKNGFDCPRISINITPEDLMSTGFVSWLMQLVDESGLSPPVIEIELTETMLMNVDQPVQDRLRELRGHGIRVAIDDFGTGYSSLSHLQRLPADVLKIDKSFIDHIPHGDGGLLITNAIVALARQFDLELVAEGIETHEQLEYLRNLDVQTGQGYLVSRPLPEPEFRAAMKNGFGIAGGQVDVTGN